MRLESGIYQSNPEDVKSRTPSDNHDKRRDVLAVYLKKDVFKNICSMQGWLDRGKYSRFAEYLDCTRQFAAGLARGVFSCENFIPLINILAQGRVDGNWSVLYEVKIKYCGIDSNHPAFNELKYRGVKPYEKYSPLADFRGGDYPIERREK